MDQSCILMKGVPKYYQTRFLNLFLILFIDNQFYIALIDEYNANLSSKKKLSIIRKRKNDKIIVAHLNINSLRNNFDNLIGQITGNTDISMVSETKLDESFPIGQFIIEVFGVPYRVDRNGIGGGLMLFVREDIPSKLLSAENSPTEALFR